MQTTVYQPSVDLLTNPLPEPVISLGIWRPSNGDYVDGMLKFLGFSEVPSSPYWGVNGYLDHGSRAIAPTVPVGVGYRGTLSNTSVGKSSNIVREWHRDCNGITELNVLLWSDVLPTQIQLPDGSVFTPRDDEIIVIDNGKCLHRRQPGCEFWKRGERNFCRSFFYWQQQ